MNLFSIDITKLLHSPVGSFDEYEFEETIPEDTWEDLTCDSPLSMHIKLIREKYGVHCVINNLSTTLSVPEDAIVNAPVHLDNISREFHLKKSPEDTDDIEYINNHYNNIGLARCLRQELLISVV